MPHLLVVTDSTCDLPAEWIRQYDIRIVPTYVNFGEQSFADDGVQLTRTGFYERLINASPYPTTSAGPAGEALAIMQQALADADQVIAITAAATLSGIFNTFRLAAEQSDPSRVTLIDSKQTTMGLGWQVLIAAEMAQDGASPAAIKSRLLDVQPRTHVWAALDTMEYLRRSGRVGWASAMVGDLLRIKPIVHLHDSVVSSEARVRTSQRAFEKLVELAHQAAPLERLAVMHTNYLDGAQRLCEALADVQPDAPLAIVNVTPVIGVHVGPNGLGLGLVRKTV